MQIQADILGINVERPEMRESTALGSALLAGFGHRAVWMGYQQARDVEQGEYRR